ncbi:Noc2p family-domain-containing protein [Pisolithus orientalis]|uniref:Noc2p family-domain-containing protein n=1 Tax=Pisolithus orientalis TaxID=936130 RepID=UPI002225B1E2|nr:Noc2p family-domain-containing protein [Pisolithus orientalis]KAI6003247.1 Noc2p family-domain-containing protein [Pisolithus orientalis]
MGKTTKKSARKFASSGKLKQTIEGRRKHQQAKKKIQGRRGAKGKGKGKERETAVDNMLLEIKEPSKKAKANPKCVCSRYRCNYSLPTLNRVKSVDDFLGAKFMEDDDDSEGEEDEEQPDSDEVEDEESIADDQSFASIDDLEDEGTTHIAELSKLAEKDPEFYKYLQENDKELLEFNPNQSDEDEDDDDEQVDQDGDTQMDDESLPILTNEILQRWKKALLEHRSLRALRRLLIAFRSAAHMNEEDQVLAWSIDSSTMYRKLITTTLRFTPIVLEHHLPYKILPSGKFKPPTQSPKQKTIQKLVLSYFNNIIHLIPQLTDNEMIQLSLTESAKILPYTITSRKSVKAYLKRCLELWSTAEDSVRIAAFLAIRKLASSHDDTILDIVLKSTYLELVRSSKSTSVHKLPSINLMKNSASELFCMDHAAAYQHAFGYIRQLAIHLRNSMKTKTKDAYKLVYNWQYVHSVDFWSLVLGRACSLETQIERGQESELKPLIYPLVQVSLGAIKLVSNARSFPLHLHIIRSMLHLSRHTKTFIPLPSYIVPIITSALAFKKPKPSTLRPLDFDSNIRVPSQYLKTRVYIDGLVEEGTFVLAEWLASPPIQGSIAFPEIACSRCCHAAQGPLRVKGMVERTEESAKWIEQKRKGVGFAPGEMAEVERWESALKVNESPLAKYVKVQQKARAKRKTLIDKVRYMPLPDLDLPCITNVLRSVRRRPKAKMRSWTIRCPFGVPRSGGTT